MFLARHHVSLAGLDLWLELGVEMMRVEELEIGDDDELVERWI